MYGFDKLNADEIFEILKRVDNPKDVITFCLLEENEYICSKPSIWVNLIRHYYPDNIVTKKPFSQFLALSNNKFSTYVIDKNLIGPAKLVNPNYQQKYNEYLIEIEGIPPNDYVWIGLSSGNGREFQSQDIAIETIIKDFNYSVMIEYAECMESFPGEQNYCWREMLNVYPDTYTIGKLRTGNYEDLRDNLINGNIISYIDSISMKTREFRVFKLYLG
jgi:hypothetical protein